MNLKPLMTMTAQLGKTDQIGDMGRGSRAIAEVVSGEFSGDRLQGTIVTPGADWVVFDGDGVGQLDVRVTLKTEDEAFIYMYYTGVLTMNAAAQAAMADGGETQFGDHAFFTQPRFECGHENYRWLNQVVAVAQGRLLNGGVQYEVFECVV